MAEEVWKDIPNFEGYYQVSNLGRVRSLDRYNTNGRFVAGKMLKPKHDKKGYLFVGLSKCGKTKPYKISRLVAYSFLQNPKKLTQVDHIDRNKENNSAENLRWTDNSTNCRNKENNVLLTFDGCTKTIAEWSEITGIKKGTLQRRKYLGWDDEDILTRKVRCFK